MKDTFPRQYARTRRFSLGEPHAFEIAPDGDRVVFLRTRTGSDSVTCLWACNPATGTERLIADPRLIGASEHDQLPAAERARRERAREGSDGITSYATDRAVRVAVFALAGQLFEASLAGAVGALGDVRPLASGVAAFDPRPSPDGRMVAYVSEGGLRVAGLGERARPDRGVADDPDPDVSWGMAEFIAAEELSRSRGFWWSPDSRRIAACRVDNRPVQRWFIGDPSNPATAPTTHRYPTAGTANAVVTLHVFDVSDEPSADTRRGEPVEVVWDNARFPYLVEVVWHAVGGLTLAVLDREQRHLQVLVADERSGETSVVFEQRNDAWIELTPGTPTWTADGELVMVDASEDVSPERRFGRNVLSVGGSLRNSDGDVRRVIGAADGRVFTVESVGSGIGTEVRAYDPAGVDTLAGDARGVADATVTGALAVLRLTTPESERARFDVVSIAAAGPAVSLTPIDNVAEIPLISPRPRFSVVGRNELNTAVLYPSSSPSGSGDESLPVLLDPYGGPHAQRVVANRNAFATSQWFADQGFAVVVVDGRGTPGKGPRFERAVHRDLAGPVLDDQVAGLEAVARADRRLDLSRVAIRGWSFGGFLAALAVLRRPDVFHCAIAGAPVADWRLYDTGYTERYLGDPNRDPVPYDRSSLLLEAKALSRPLMLIHGLADDNVVAAHTLQLSSALLAAGRPHEVLPLSRVTHMTPQEVVAENLLLLQLDFLRRCLGVPVGVAKP